MSGGPLDAVGRAIVAAAASKSGRVDAGAAAVAGRRDDSETWAVVASVDPLRVTLPTGSGPAEIEPAMFVPREDLAVGARVRMRYIGRVLTVTDRQWGGASDHSGWADLPLLAPWTRYSPSFRAPRLTVRAGVVHLSGMVAGPDGGGPEHPIATLPAWARPDEDLILTANEEGVPMDLQVADSGAVWLRADAGPVGWLSLDGCSFAL